MAHSALEDANYYFKQAIEVILIIAKIRMKSHWKPEWWLEDEM